MFFSTLGLQWEYEKEGYDLGDLGGYLPDFWFPIPRGNWGNPLRNSQWCGWTVAECSHCYSSRTGSALCGLNEEDQGGCVHDDLEAVIDEGFWVEIKATKPTKEEYRKARRLTRLTGMNCLLIYGSPWPGECYCWPLDKEYDAAEHPPIPVVRPFHALRMLLDWGTSSIPDSAWFMVPPECEARVSVIAPKAIPFIEYAFSAARSARFEHGETPA